MKPHSSSNHWVPLSSETMFDSDLVEMNLLGYDDRKTRENFDVFNTKSFSALASFGKINNVVLFKIIFLVSGVVSTLVTQWLYYVKVADGTNFLTVTTIYFGMSLVKILPALGKNKTRQTHTEKLSQNKHKNILKALGVFDVFIGGILTAGMFKLGSSLFQVVFSLLIPFTALLARFFLKRRLYTLQWWGILAIAVGFSFNTMISYMSSQSISTEQITKSQNFAANNIIQGVLMTLIGVFLCAGHYVVSEKLLSQKDGPSPTEMCYTVGIYGSISCVLIFVFYTLPHRYQAGCDLIDLAIYSTDVIKKKDAIVFLFSSVGGFLILTILHTVQTYSYYLLLEISGAVSTGVLQALKSVGVIGLSSFIFCGFDPNQCFSTEKFGSATMVIFGAIIYSLSGKRH